MIPLVDVQIVHTGDGPSKFRYAKRFVEPRYLIQQSASACSALNSGIRERAYDREACLDRALLLVLSPFNIQIREG